MGTKAVILNLRVARPSDFTNEIGGKKYGCMYFQQSFTGNFCNQPFFFHENTDLEVFRELFKAKQIWVLAGVFEEVEFVEKRKPIIDDRKYNLKTTKTRTKRPCFCSKKIIKPLNKIENDQRRKKS